MTHANNLSEPSNAQALDPRNQQSTSSVSTASPPTGLPLWPAERLVSLIGRYPAAVGRMLDRLAARRDPVGWIVRFFSSVKLGLLWLFLTGGYMALGSGLPALRAYFDVSTMEFFSAPPMIILMLLLCVTLAVVTLRRIPLTLYKLGVWTVHTGIITLVTGCFFYFGLKHEGMVRLFIHHTVRHYYDSSERALYIGAAGDQSAMLPLPSLPIFVRRTPADSHPLNISVPAKTLEKLNPKFSDLRVRIVGYYPYAEMAAFPVPRRPGVKPRQPAVEVNLNADGTSGGRWLVAKSPADRVLDNHSSPFGIEYLYHPSQRRWRDITTSFTGRDALIVSVPADHVRRVYVIHKNKPLLVRGTPYTLTPRRWIDIPLMARAYHGASSQGYMVNVERRLNGKIFHFQRVALFRYPSQSVDFIFPHGHRQLVPNLVDHHIRIVYEDARHNQFWVVEHRSGALSLVQRAAGGAVSVNPLTVGRAVPVSIDGMHIGFSVVQTGTVVLRPYTIPADQRRPKVEDTMGKCVLQLAVSDGRGLSREVYLPYEQFGLEGQLPPTSVKIPDVGRVRFAFSQLRLPLPVAVTLLDCKELFYPGGHNFPRDFISKVRMTNLKTGVARVRVIHLNHPAKIAGLSFFQARFGHKRNGQPFSVLGVGNTHGFYAMLTGVVMIILGIGYAFYIKPILLNIKKKQLAEYAKRRSGDGASV